MAKPKRTTKANKLTEFTIFRKLAPELRNMIWELVPEANVVEIWAEQEWTVDPDGEPKRVFGLFASYKVPAVLQVSREARIVALKCFTKIFEAQTEDRTIYFNTDLDVLSIRNNVTFQCLCSLGGITLSGNQSSAYSPIMNKLRRLQFGQDPCWFLQENKKRILSAFGKPELVVMHHKSGSRRTHYSFEVLKQDIEQNWGNEADKNGDKYKPELHVLTALQLAKMLKKIDNPQPQKRAKAPKTLLPAVRHSDRFVDRPLSYYEGGKEDEYEEGGDKGDKGMHMDEEAMEEENDEEIGGKALEIDEEETSSYLN